jgi:1,4-dihydroxy-2-naphthoyl-CoA hydrolase
MTDPTVDYDDQDAALALLPTAALHERLGIKFLEVRPDRTVGRMPVEGNTQPYGLLHGGASCVLAEGLASFAATLHGMAMSPQQVAIGVDINATHHRAARTGYVTGVATPAHLGRSMATYEVTIDDDSGRRVCTARLTCLLRPASDYGL